MEKKTVLIYGYGELAKYVGKEVEASFPDKNNNVVVKFGETKIVLGNMGIPMLVDSSEYTHTFAFSDRNGTILAITLQRP